MYHSTNNSIFSVKVGDTAVCKAAAIFKTP